MIGKCREMIARANIFKFPTKMIRASSGTKLPTKMIERKTFPTNMIASQSHVTLIIITIHQHKPCTSLVYVGF